MTALRIVSPGSWKDYTIPVLIAVILIAGFVAVRSIGATAAARAVAGVAKADAKAFQATADAALALADSLGLETTRLEAETARVRAESDEAVERLRGRMRELVVRRTIVADSLRLVLPDSLQALFAEHEQIHAAELAAAEHVIGQTNRKLRAADVLAVTHRAQIGGLEAALIAQTERGDRWKLSSDKFEQALKGSWFGNLLGDVPKYLTGAAVGAILVSR